MNQRAPPSGAFFTPTLTRRLFGLAAVAFGAGASVEVLESKKSAAIRRQLAAESMATVDHDAAAFTRFVAAEIARWTPAMRSVAHAAR